MNDSPVYNAKSFIYRIESVGSPKSPIHPVKVVLGLGKKKAKHIYMMITLVEAVIRFNPGVETQLKNFGLYIVGSDECNRSG
jgi:hypothetical protein